MVDIYLAAFFFFFFFLLRIILFLWGRSLNNLWWGSWLLLLLFLDGNKEADHILGHLVAPCHQSVLEHLGVDLSFQVISLESLNNQVVGVISVSSHLLLEHLDHVLVGAGATNLSEKLIKLRLGREDTNIVKSSTEVVFVNGAIFVDVHQLETVLVH